MTCWPVQLDVRLVLPSSPFEAVVTHTRPAVSPATQSSVTRTLAPVFHLLIKIRIFEKKNPTGLTFKFSSKSLIMAIVFSSRDYQARPQPDNQDMNLKKSVLSIH